MQIPGLPLGGRPLALPAIHLTGVSGAQKRSRNSRAEQDDGHAPMKREEQAGHREERDSALHDLDQAIQDTGRPKGRLLLGTLKRIVVLRVLVVFQIDCDGLGVENIVHVIGHHLSLCVADERSDRTAECTHQGDSAGQPDQQRDPSEGFFSVVRDGCDHGIHYELDEVECQQRERGLEDEERPTGQCPAWSALPDEP